MQAVIQAFFATYQAAAAAADNALPLADRALADSAVIDALFGLATCKAMVVEQDDGSNTSEMDDFSYRCLPGQTIGPARHWTPTIV